MALIEEQKRHIKKQFLDHRHEKHEVDIELAKDVVLRRFIVFPNILRPDRVSSMLLANYLYTHKSIFKKKTCLDMGCGSGLQGIVMGVYGAKKIILSDISRNAFKNTKENVLRFKLNRRSEVFFGDLFEKIKGPIDVIVFNHPFFPGKAIKNEPLSLALLDEGVLLRRFLKDAKHYLTKNGFIIMPYHYLGGSINDPAIQAPKFGYLVENVYQLGIPSGLKSKNLSIFKLKLK